VGGGGAGSLSLCLEFFQLYKDSGGPGRSALHGGTGKVGAN
jgi:hypothetical protein